MLTVDAAEILPRTFTQVLLAVALAWASLLAVIGRFGLTFFANLSMLADTRTEALTDALTGLEANLRFTGPETMETKIFGRLSAWQNWIFNRPNASGPEGALRRFGTGQRAAFDRKRV